jgi:hypothetical protein
MIRAFRFRTTLSTVSYGILDVANCATRRTLTLQLLRGICEPRRPRKAPGQLAF